MNSLTIIGNLTKRPELRTTQGGVNVCSFTVAVNRRKKEGQEHADADFFNVNAWRQLGENCAKFLDKGRKVCIVGPVSVRTYTRNDGTFGASLEVEAKDVEFLSPRNDNVPAGNTQVDPDDSPY